MMGALFSLALAGAAAAEPFQSFADMCVSTDASAHRAELVAKGAGWRDATSLMPADSGEAFQNTTVFLNFDPANPGDSTPGDMEVLMTGWADGEAILDIKGVVLDVCGVMSPEGDPLRMGKRLTDHLGLPASAEDGGTMPVWLYSRQGDRFVSEAGLIDAEDEEFLAAVRQRSVYAVYVFDADGLAGLFVGAVRPEAKAADR
jgi:hypothetical protein